MTLRGVPLEGVRTKRATHFCTNFKRPKESVDSILVLSGVSKVRISNSCGVP